MKWTKIYLLVLLFGGMIFSLRMATAQSIDRLFITTRGDYEITVRVSESEAVVLNDRGDILEHLIVGKDHFQDRGFDADGAEFSYNSDGYLERLGRATFDYYNSLIDSEYVKGKLRRVGSVNIAYADSLTDPDYMRGKVRQIGKITIAYHESLIDEEYIKGKIKRIGSVDFRYFDSLMDSKNLLGKLKSGRMVFTLDGIQIRVRDVK